jgi:hypothetical protein
VKCHVEQHLRRIESPITYLGDMKTSLRPRSPSTHQVPCSIKPPMGLREHGTNPTSVPQASQTAPWRISSDLSHAPSALRPLNAVHSSCSFRGLEEVAFVGYHCIAKCYVSRLMLRPNLAYSSTFNCDISSLTVESFSSNTVTSSSILVVFVDSISWTSGRGREMKESPIL